MSLWILLATAGSMGLLGGLHCIAMCSAMQRLAIHGGASPAARVIRLQPVAQGGAAPPRGVGLDGAAMPLAGGRFHAARIAGYAMLGAAVGGGSSLLRWGAENLPLMRPLWAGANALLLALGLALLVLGRQPAWLDALGQRIGRATGAGDAPAALRPVAAGLAWSLLPCGLLYSALATAALASDPLSGAAAMATFGAGTTVGLAGADGFVRLLGGLASARAARIETAGTRIGGALLAAMAVAALVALALGQPHPFCR